MSQEREEGWAVPIDRVAAFTSGAAMAVEVGQIEKELMALWRHAAERAKEAGSELAVVRATLWNFIVHKRGEDSFVPLKATLDELALSVPARMIVLLERLGEASLGALSGDESLRASVEANTRPGPGGRRELVAEEITLEAPRMEAARLPALVRSLLLPDLPTAVFLSGVAPDADRLGPLLLEADRIIIDTGRLMPGHLRQMVRALSPLESGTHPVEIADLGWLRTASWRRLVAALFDEAPAALSAIEDVHIEYAANHLGGETAALLLCGWLSLRLGWTVEGGDILCGEATVRSERGQSLRIAFSRVEDRRAPMGLAAVTIRAAGSTFRAYGGGSESSPCIDIERPSLPAQAQLVQERRDGELLDRALGAFGRDAMLMGALRAAAAFVPASAATPTVPPGRPPATNLSYA